MRLFAAGLLACLSAGPGFAAAPRQDEKRETVLDRVVHIDKDLHLEVPRVPRLCDSLELKKQRVKVDGCDDTVAKTIPGRSAPSRANVVSLIAPNQQRPQLAPLKSPRSCHRRGIRPWLRAPCGDAEADWADWADWADDRMLL